MPQLNSVFRCLALAGALFSTGAWAQSVSLLAHNGAATPGGVAVVDVDFNFSGPYSLLSLYLQFDYDTSLVWEQASSAVTWGGNTAALDSTLLGLKAGGATIDLTTPSAGQFIISGLFGLAPPSLAGTATLHAAFRLPQNAAIGSVWGLAIYSRVSDDVSGVEVELGMPASVTAVPEPAGGWLMAAGLAGLAVLARRRAAAC